MIKLLLNWMYKPTEGILELKNHLLNHPDKWTKDDHYYSFNGIKLWIATGWDYMSVKGSCELSMIERAYLWDHVRKSMNMNSDIVKRKVFK